MLHEDFEADQNQNDAAGPFCPGFVACSKRGADLDSDHGNKKGGASDKGNCRKNPYFQKCEGDADRQRVDACCAGILQLNKPIMRYRPDKACFFNVKFFVLYYSILWYFL